MFGEIITHIDDLTGFRIPKGPTPNKYKPHQGAQEKARRRQRKLRRYDDGPSMRYWNRSYGFPVATFRAPRRFTGNGRVRL